MLGAGNQVDARLVKTTVIMVGVSYVLSRMILGNMLFTVPLLVLAPKFSDRKGALLPVGLVALLVSCTELFRSRDALGSPEGMILLLIGLFIPTVLLVASVVWITMANQRTVYRYLASCVFAVVASFAVVIWFSKPSETLMRVDSAFYETFRVILGQSYTDVQGPLAVSDEALKGLYRMSVLALGALLAPLSMALIGFASFLAMSYQARLDSSFSIRVARWRVPQSNLWIFLGAWTVVLGTLLLHAPYVYRALALQVALGSSVLYAVQGMAIVTHLLGRKGLVVNTGRMFTMVFLFAFLVPGVNLLVVFVLPLLGVTETWIVYRRNE